MNENARIDDNSRNTITALANDGSGDIMNVRINPVTGALVVEADVTSSNTMIGSTIPGGTPGSVLYIGPGSTLAEDNTVFFWDETGNFLGLGTNTPSATLHVDGTIRFDLGGDATGDIYYRDSGGDTISLPIGVDGSVLTVASGLPSWEPSTSFSGYNRIQIDDVNVNPQRQILNFLDFFIGTDNAGNTSTDIELDVSALANDTTFVTDLVNNNTFTTLLAQDINFIDTLIANNYFTTNLAGDVNFIDSLVANNYFTTELANNNNFITTLTNNATFIGDITTIINNAGPSIQIDLTTQVTGVLPLANGGTGAALSDPGFDAVYVWDNTMNVTRLAQLSGLSYDTATNTLTSSGGGGSVDVQVFLSNGTWNKPVSATSTSPVRVICVGAGGGGGSGETRVLGNTKSGGYGGGGGAVTIMETFAGALTSTVAVTVGTGGAGGAAVATPTTTGNDGATGGTSSFGTYMSAPGGGGGNKGQSGDRVAGVGGSRIGTVSNTNGISGQGTQISSATTVTGGNTEWGGASGGGNFNATTGPGGSSLYAGPGGGCGGGDTGSNASPASAGGTNNSYSSGGGGAAGTSGASPTAGGNGVSQINYCGQGGGGGGSSRAVSAAAGGNGGLGAGGGGGGSAVNGSSSGAGGSGGNGYVFVITFI